MRVALTGSSGLIGSALSRHLRTQGHDVIAVVRRPPNDNEIGWSIDENRIDDNAFSGIDAVVHLAGAGIGDHRWTASYKQELVSSRTVGTTLVAEAVRTADKPPPVGLGDRLLRIESDSHPRRDRRQRLWLPGRLVRFLGGRRRPCS